MNETEKKQIMESLLAVAKKEIRITYEKAVLPYRL